MKPKKPAAEAITTAADPTDAPTWRRPTRRWFLGAVATAAAAATVVKPTTEQPVPTRWIGHC